MGAPSAPPRSHPRGPMRGRPGSGTVVHLVQMHYAEGSRLSRQPLPDVFSPGPAGCLHRRSDPTSGPPQLPATKGCAVMVPEPRPAELTTTWMDADGHMTLRVLRPGPHTVLVRV